VKNENSLKFLILEYNYCAEYFCKNLKDYYDCGEDLLMARRQNLIPKEGKIENLYFNFHGVGCYFETLEDQIDIDFGPNNRNDGFDFMRLRHFLKSRLEKYNELEDENIMKLCFNLLIDKNIILKPNLEPSSHLFYLNDILKE
jgi:hypothetical protein